MLDNLIQQYLAANDLQGENGADYNYMDDENGNPFIDKWDFAIPKPTFTKVQLDTEKLKLEKENNIKLLEIALSDRIDREYPSCKYKSILLKVGGYTDIDLNNMKNFTESSIGNFKTLEMQINACSTIQQLKDLKPSILQLIGG